MKKIILLYFFISLKLFSQEKIDINYFTLGLVNDYLGRNLVLDEKDNPITIDYIYKREKSVIHFLDSLIKIENSSKNIIEKIDFIFFKDTITLNCSNCEEFYIVKSKNIATKINSFYYIKPVDIQEIENPKAEEVNYFSYIDLIKMKNKNQQKSFLYGAFLRYGSFKNGMYTLELANSVSKFYILKKILKKIDCKILSFKENAGIPSNQIISFTTDNSEIIAVLNRLLKNKI
ncbi:hypothetical protein [Flavobacterium sp.]|uniref:hypothetical protein n=1 Tax=Flavobacterium sp. TaxID=239 RepID=UPI00375076D3